MQLLHCLLSSTTRNDLRRQLFSSTCRIHTRIRNEICMRQEKNSTREQSFLKGRAVSNRYIDSRPSFVTHATLASTRTTQVAFRTNLYLQHVLGVASRIQYNAHMRMYVNANAIAVQLHTDRHRVGIARGHRQRAKSQPSIPFSSEKMQAAFLRA